MDLQWTQVEDVVQMMTRLGLSRDEAVVYTTLSFLGPSRAGVVAGASKLSRAQAYRALEFLTGRGVVRGDLSRPRLFTAAPIESLLVHLRGELENQSQELRLLEPDLRSALGVPPRGTRPATSRTDILRGRNVVATRANELYAAARKQADVVFTHPGGIPLLEKLGHWAHVQALARNGVKVRLILASRPDHADSYKIAEAFPGLEIRERSQEDVLAAMVVDWQDALVVLVADPGSYPRSDRTVALTSDAPNLVVLLGASFEGLWRLARPVHAGESSTAASPKGSAGFLPDPSP